MRSPNTSAAEGFTLIELTLVVGLLALAAAGLGLGGEALVFRQRRSEEETLLSALRAARSAAMRNVGGIDHGVHYDPASGYTLFDGDTFDPSVGGITFASNGAAQVGWPPHDPVFRSLDGAAQATTITLARGGRITSIDIGYEGRIDVH